MRTKKGIITSAKMTGTVTVTVHRHAVHPKYRKRYRISKKYLVDTKGFNDLHEGDEVIIGECKPISKNKHFKIVEIVKRSALVSDLCEEEGLDTAMNRLGQERENEINESTRPSVGAEEKEPKDNEKKDDSPDKA